MSLGNQDTAAHFATDARLSIALEEFRVRSEEISRLSRHLQMLLYYQLAVFGVALTVAAGLLGNAMFGELELRYALVAVPVVLNGLSASMLYQGSLLTMNSRYIGLQIRPRLSELAGDQRCLRWAEYIREQQHTDRYRLAFRIGGLGQAVFSAGMPIAMIVLYGVRVSTDPLQFGWAHLVIQLVLLVGDVVVIAFLIHAGLWLSRVSHVVPHLQENQRVEP